MSDVVEVVGQRNAQALFQALTQERARLSEALAHIEGMRASLEGLRAEVETLRKLVIVQRAGTGPTVRE